MDPDLAYNPVVSVQDLRISTASASLRGRSPVVVQLWWIVRGTLFACSPQFMLGWRRWLLRCFGAEIGPQVNIRPSVKILYPWKLTIGARTQIGDEAQLNNVGPITLGADTVISQRAFLCAGTHDISTNRFETLGVPIVVEDEAWICANAFIHPGSRVGRGAIIAAQAVLRGHAEPYGIYAGSLAQRVGDRRDRLKREEPISGEA